MEYLENHGKQIKQFLFTHGLKNDRLLSAITVGYFIFPTHTFTCQLVIVFIRLSDLPDSSLALWRKQLFQIVLCVMSKNVFCKCTKIFFYPLCVCVFRGVAVLIWCSWRSTQCSTVKTVNFLFTSKLYRWHVLN